MNNLTGRLRQSPGQCSVSANAIASQLVKNGKYEGSNREAFRLVMQELSNLWRATTPDAGNISVDFSRREFDAALNHLKPGKAPCSDSICRELLIHAGASLQFWLRGFLSFYLRQIEILKV